MFKQPVSQAKLILSFDPLGGYAVRLLPALYFMIYAYIFQIVFNHQVFCFFLAKV